MRRYTLRQLDTFLEVAKDLSISAAAKRLHVTQPAVSMQMQLLEEALGLPLFEQIGRKLKLTDAGMELKNYAASAIAQLKNLDVVLVVWFGFFFGWFVLVFVCSVFFFLLLLLVFFR